MSSFECKVVGFDLAHHPNADSLSVATIHRQGWQCVVRTSDLVDKDRAIYIPLDALLPEAPEWEFMRPRKFRVKTIKLRGLISQGLLVPLLCTCGGQWSALELHPDSCLLHAGLGFDAKDLLNIKKWEPPPPPPWMTGKCEPDDPSFQKYTDIENYKKFVSIIQPGEMVRITEKCHGCNGRWGLTRQPDGSLAYKIGSHNKVKAQDDNNIWAKISERYSLRDVLSRAQDLGGRVFMIPDLISDTEIVLFGEVYGHRIQDLQYGLKDIDVAFFDVMVNGRYLAYPQFAAFCTALNLPMVPLLFSGPWSPELVSFADGKNVAGVPDTHVREGCVIKPVIERWDQELGRVVLKVISDQYLLRGEHGTEFH